VFDDVSTTVDVLFPKFKFEGCGGLLHMFP
jgi:hypothetical protein